MLSTVQSTLLIIIALKNAFVRFEIGRYQVNFMSRAVRNNKRYQSEQYCSIDSDPIVLWDCIDLYLFR
jgi:hypothetical protein